MSSAAAQRIDLLNKVQRFFRCVDVWIRAKIIGTIFFYLTGNLNARVTLIGDLDVRIAGSPLKLDVIVRLMFLNQRNLKQKALFVRIGGNDIKIRDLINHCRDLPRMTALKIRADPVLEILCLADIDDLTIDVFH